MTAFILSNIGAFLWAAGALAVALFGAFMKRAGRNAEKAKQVAAEAKARDIADDVDNDIGALTPAQRRERLREWVR